MENEFGIALRDLRRRARLTIKEMAFGMGISGPYLSQVERGKKPPFSVEHTRCFVKLVAHHSSIDIEPTCVNLESIARRKVENSDSL